MDVSACSTQEQLLAGFSAVREGVVVVRTDAANHIEDTILRMLASRMREGASALVVCADGTRAQEYAKAAARRTSAGEQAPVTTVREAALRVLLDEDAPSVCGRDARVLDGNEKDVLVEDVKVTGVKPRRLREMLKFFFNSIANCTDDAPTWIASDEEQRVYSVLMENLEARRAMLDCELSAFACKALGCVPGGERRHGADVVVAHGYDLMSATSQNLVRELAGGLFIAVGCGADIASCDEPYPNHEGFSQLEEACDARLRAGGARRSVSVTLRSVKTPADEFETVADAIAEAAGAGARDRDGILVGVPNRLWGEKLEEALSARGVACATDFGPAKTAGDPRVREKCGLIAARAFFKLSLDADDVTALRTWVGAGDWLLCSDAFLEILAWARTHDMDVLSALRHLHAHADEAAETMLFSKIGTRMDALDELRAIWETGDAAAIDGAFAAHGLEWPAGAREMLSAAGGHAGAETRARIARAGLSDGGTGLFRGSPACEGGAPACEGGAGAAGPDVLVAPYRRCLSRSCARLFLTGMVNGFMPSLRAVDDRYSIDERAKARRRERAVFEVLEATPAESLELSLFSEDLLENAGKLGMETTRIFAEDGVQRAYIAPSLFVGEMQESATVTAAADVATGTDAAAAPAARLKPRGE